MTKKLLKQYEIVLKRLENSNWVKKEMVFIVLNIDDRETIDTLISLNDADFKQYFINKGDIER